MPSRPRPTAGPAAEPKVTILDVARYAEVSVGTVSHVLNDNGRVSETRRERVLAAVAALGYAPNRLAQGLRRGRSHLIGICLPHMASAYFAALFDQLEGLAAQDGYEVVQVLSHQDPALERRRLAALLGHQLAGLLILPSPTPQPGFDLVAAAKVPMVVLDRASRDDRFDYVTLDDRAAMREVAQALIGLGHRRLLYLVSYPGLITTRHRIEAFRRVARGAAGGPASGAADPVTAAVMVKGEDEPDFAVRLAAVMRGPARPTAIIASNTLAALWLLRALARLRLRCPEDVSILAFEHPDWADILSPPLAVVEPPSEAMAALAWRLLRERMAKAGLPCRRHELRATLLLRGSVAAPEAGALDAAAEPALQGS